MIALIFLALNLLAALVKSKSRLEAENAALRQQLIVLQRKLRGRVRFSNDDRLFFIQLYRWFCAQSGAPSYAHDTAVQMIDTSIVRVPLPASLGTEDSQWAGHEAG
jgi:hypothetical protein